jgi:hypothetical protein
MKRHHCQDVIVFEIEVSRSWLTRSKAGLSYTSRDVPPCRIKHTVAVDED